MSEYTVFEYEKDGAAIYRQSFATIRAEADLSGLPDTVAQVAVRMIHACGMTDLPQDLGYTPEVELRATQTGLRAQVTDPGTGFPPAGRRRELDEPGGWGLVLVERLAASWGVERDERTRVWFELAAA